MSFNALAGLVRRALSDEPGHTSIVGGQGAGKERSARAGAAEQSKVKYPLSTWACLLRQIALGLIIVMDKQTDAVLLYVTFLGMGISSFPRGLQVIATAMPIILVG